MSVYVLARISRPLIAPGPSRARLLQAAYSTTTDSSSIEQGPPRADDALLAKPAATAPSPSPPSSSAVLNAAQVPDHQLVLDIPPAQDPLLHYLASHIMRDGKRKTAEGHIMKMLLHIHAFTRAPPLPIVREAIARASPSVKVITHKGTTKNTLIPVALTERQRTRYAVEWIFERSDKQLGRSISERAAREIINVVKGTSEVLKDKERFHRAALVNRYVRSAISGLLRKSDVSLVLQGEYQGYSDTLAYCISATNILWDSINGRDG